MFQRVHDLLLQLDAALRERFGDAEVSHADVRTFLREHLLSEGRPPDEVDHILRDLT